jgi:hypothetical protein
VGGGVGPSGGGPPPRPGPRAPAAPAAPQPQNSVATAGVTADAGAHPDPGGTRSSTRSRLCAAVHGTFTPTPVSRSVIALIPAYNAARLVGGVIAKAKLYLPVLVVDDGSRDETSDAANAAGADVVRQEPNQGKGAALKHGFRIALERGYDAVLTLDADGQHDPAEIPKFLAARAERGADLIIGARDFAQMPFVRRMSNTIGTWSFSRALGRPVRDNQSGFRLLSRRLANAMLESDEQGFELEVEMIVSVD